MAKFEFVEKYKDCGLELPVRKTAKSAGYDLAAVEDIVIPSYMEHYTRMEKFLDKDKTYSTDEISRMTKELGCKPTLVPTGLKCKLEPNTYLELAVRSSTPLKNWLILANGVGIIDADYYNSKDSEGHIYLQIINLSPVDIEIKKGEFIGQGLIHYYITTEDDCATGDRIGGFGSTTTKEG